MKFHLVLQKIDLLHRVAPSIRVLYVYICIFYKVYADTLAEVSVISN